MTVIEELISELEDKKLKEMNSYFRKFYSETIELLKNKYLEKENDITKM